MQPYRPLPDQAAEQILARPHADRRARLLVPAGHGVRRATGPNTSRAPSRSRRSTGEAERMRYFHGSRRCMSSPGEDYRGVWRLGASLPGDVLPPYTELVRFDAGPARCRARSSASAARGCCWRPSRPAGPRATPSSASVIARSAISRLLLQGDAEDYHAYAFATVRMAGSAFEAADLDHSWLLHDKRSRVAQASGGSSTAARRCRSGSRAAGRSTPSHVDRRAAPVRGMRR